MNLKALAAEATRSDGIIEFVPQVGDFVGAQEPLFRLYGGARAVERQQAAGGRRLWIRAHDGAGSDVCVSDFGRHSAQSPV